jgi:hypothetical protein
MGQVRDRMEEDLKLRNVSPATRKVYLLYARKFVAHYRRPPSELGEREIRWWPLHLMQVELVLYETYHQCLAAMAEAGRGDFPQPLRIGPKTVRWRLSDVEAYLAALAGEAGR